MKSSYITNFVLLLIVIGLVWFTQRDSQQTAEIMTLSLIKASDIKQIKIQRTKQATINLVLEQNDWQLTQPYAAQANATRVKLLLSLLGSTIHGQFHPMDQSSLAQFGLAAPSVIVSFNDHDFAFGNIEPLSKNRYVMYNNVIYLIDDMVMPLLTSSADSFVENHLINAADTLVKLHLPVFDTEHKQMTHFVDISQTEGHWQSDMSSLSSDALVTLVDNWQHAQAMQVHHFDTAEPGKSVSSSIQLWTQGYSEPINLELTIEGQNLLLTNPATQLQYIFPLAIKAELFPTSGTP